MDDRALAEIFVDAAAAIGLSRPAAQCFAALWRAPGPAPADVLVETAGIARSNVSTALKELRAWGLVEPQRLPGDRRTFFAPLTDPWLLIARIAAERERRALAPVVDRLRRLGPGDPRTAALAEALATVSGWQAGLGRLSPSAAAAYLGGRGLGPDGSGAASGPEPRRKKKKPKK